MITIDFGDQLGMAISGVKRVYYNGTTATSTGTTNPRIAIRASSTDVTVYFEEEHDSTETYDNRPDRTVMRGEPFDVQQDAVRAKRPPLPRSHCETIKMCVGPSEGIISVYFAPRYKARSRSWTGQNFRRFE